MDTSLFERLCDAIGADALDRLAYADDESALIEDAEQRIANRGLEARYVIALGDIITDIQDVASPSTTPDDIRIIWRFLRATPEQRARAALTVLA